MDTIYIGIDPGQRGAIAVRDVMGGVYVDKMPATPTDRFDYLREIAETARMEDVAVVAAIERVGHFFPVGPKCPVCGKQKGGGSPASMVSLGINYGELRGFLIAKGISVEGVMPNPWMDVVVPGRPKGKKSTTPRKNYIKGIMQELYPRVKVIQQTADALGILTWLLRQRGVC